MKNLLLEILEDFEDSHKLDGCDSEKCMTCERLKRYRKMAIKKGNEDDSQKRA